MSDDQPKRKPPGERPPVVVTYRTPSAPEPASRDRGQPDRFRSPGPRGASGRRSDAGHDGRREAPRPPNRNWDERPAFQRDERQDNRWDRGPASQNQGSRTGRRDDHGWDAPHARDDHRQGAPDPAARWDQRDGWSQREDRRPSSRQPSPRPTVGHHEPRDDDRRPQGGRPPARREFRDLGQAAIKPLNPADVVLAKSQGPWPVFLPCGQGIEELLLAEVQALMPETHPRLEKGGVALHTDARGVMALNLESRLATRVLLELAHAPYGNENDLYTLAKAVDWPAWISPLENFCINTSAHRSPLQSLNFATLRVKDGLCDRMREDTDDRPSVDTRFPHLQLALHLGPTQAHLYVDASGESLFKRGWREDKGDAPLKETLAAAMLAAAGWKGTPDEGGALMDPCCGSGTIPIEAAQIACGIAPGLFRRFAFEMLPLFKRPEMRSLWAQLKLEAKQRIHAPAVPIIASDVAFRMMDFARRNAERAGVAHAIEFHGGDALQRPAPPLPEGLSGTLMLNPPYGERIATRGTAAEDDFFPKLASHWKKQYTGWSAWLLCPEMKLPGLMRLKESRRIPMWNGPIECRLFRFDLQAGSLRKDRQGADPEGPAEEAL